MLETQRQLAQAMPVSPTPTLASLPLGAYDFRVTQAASASSTPALGHSMTSFQLDSIFCAMPGTSTLTPSCCPAYPPTAHAVAVAVEYRALTATRTAASSTRAGKMIGDCLTKAMIND